jgi:serine/threonine protein kinase
VPRVHKPGDVVDGRYRLKARLGAGGMGTVWRARHETLGIDVALKQLTVPDDISEAERRERVARARREGSVLAQLKPHPHIVGVRDLIEEDEIPWLVMGLVDGRSLTHVVREDGPLGVDEAIRLGEQLTSALSAVHEQHVLHRDVKPDNVLITPEGDAVLVDFGIAVLAGGEHVTSSGVIVGTQDYLDPERASGKPLRPASDLFCLGTTLYYTLEGRSPFHRDTLLAAAHAILSERPVTMSHAGPLGPLISDLLEPDPDRRPDAGEVLRRLRHVMSTAGSPTRTAHARPSPAPRTPTEVDRPGQPGAGPGGGSSGRSRRSRQPPKGAGVPGTGGPSRSPGSAGASRPSGPSGSATTKTSGQFWASGAPDGGGPGKQRFPEGLPSHLRPHVVAWLTEATDVDMRRRIAAKFRLRMAYPHSDPYRELGTAQVLEAVDFVLRSGEPLGDGYHSLRAPMVRKLNKLLEDGGCAYCVHPAGNKLVRRGPDEPLEETGGRRERGSAAEGGDAAPRSPAGVLLRIGLTMAACLAVLVALVVALLPMEFPLLMGAGSGKAMPVFTAWTYFSGDSPILLVALVLAWLADTVAITWFFDSEEGGFASLCVILALAWVASYAGAHLHFLTPAGKFVGGLPGVHLP